MLVFFFHKRKKKEESLARTHTRVPIAHSHESSVTHLRSPQICCHSPLSFGRLFFPRNVILRKKTEKNAPKKNTPTLYPKVSLGLSQQKSDDFDARGTVHARPIDRERKPSLFFCLDARERESERETFSSSGVALERSAFISIPFRSPPNTSRGVQIFNRNADDASGRALAR